MAVGTEAWETDRGGVRCQMASSVILFGALNLLPRPYRGVQGDIGVPSLHLRPERSPYGDGERLDVLPVGLEPPAVHLPVREPFSVGEEIGGRAPDVPPRLSPVAATRYRWASG